MAGAGAAIAQAAGELAGLAGSIIGANSQKKAAKINARAAQEINRQQLEFAREIRGGNGSPVFLPLYSGDREQELFDLADDFFTQAVPSPDRASEVAATVAPFERSLSSALSDVQSGERTDRLLANTAPVREARTSGASAGLDSINQALDETLAKLNAAKTRQGFSGGGSSTSSRAVQATADARQRAAATITAANLANEREVAGIKNSGEDLALELALRSPEFAQSVLTLQAAPNMVPIQEFLQAASVFQPFNTSGTAGPASQLVGSLRVPQVSSVSPVANGLGFLAGSSTQFANQLMQQEMLDQLILQSQLSNAGNAGVQLPASNFTTGQVA